MQDSASEGIVFHRSSEEEEEDSSHSPVSSSKRAEEEEERRRIIQINTLYIQMEFCEKKTLRDSINSGLYKETSKVWRMFR